MELLLHPDGWPTLTGKAAILSTQSPSRVLFFPTPKCLTALGSPGPLLPRISCCIALLAPYVRTALAYHGRPLLRPLQRQSSRAQCYALASADSPSLTPPSPFGFLLASCLLLLLRLPSTFTHTLSPHISHSLPLSKPQHNTTQHITSCCISHLISTFSNNNPIPPQSTDPISSVASP
ncbi:hypothetical protein GGI42DRAFT_310572 [Trichoderma sp. SZMC 28013]